MIRKRLKLGQQDELLLRLSYDTNCADDYYTDFDKVEALPEWTFDRAQLEASAKCLRDVGLMQILRFDRPFHARVTETGRRYIEESRQDLMALPPVARLHKVQWSTWGGLAAIVAALAAIIGAIFSFKALP